MDLDEQPSKRPRDTPSSSTQQFDFDNPDEFMQRARNVSVPLPRFLSNLCPLRRHLFSQCHMETLQLRHHSCRFRQRHHFNVFQKTAPVTPRVENSKIAPPAPSFSVPVSRSMPSTFAVPSTLLPDSVVAHSHADPVVAHDHAPTQFDEESAVDTQSDDPFQV